jgi:hypothetical protein
MVSEQTVEIKNVKPALQQTPCYRFGRVINRNMSKLVTATRLVGDSKDRIRADFYPTPGWAVTALLQREDFTGSCWEPACGKGDISKILEENGYDVYSTDILDYGYGQHYYKPAFQYSIGFYKHEQTVCRSKNSPIFKNYFFGRD